MSKKWLMTFSLVCLICSFETTHYQYKEYLRLKGLKKRYQHMKTQLDRRITREFDGSELINHLMKYAKSYRMLVVKLEPKNNQMFHLILEGHYQFFVQWITRMHQEIPHIHWQKILIRKISANQQRFFLIGVYDE